MACQSMLSASICYQTPLPYAWDSQMQSVKSASIQSVLQLLFNIVKTSAGLELGLDSHEQLRFLTSSSVGI